MKQSVALLSTSLPTQLMIRNAVPDTASYNNRKHTAIFEVLKCFDKHI
jgi:hypothetical protein